MSTSPEGFSSKDISYLSDTAGRDYHSLPGERRMRIHLSGMTETDLIPVVAADNFLRVDAALVLGRDGGVEVRHVSAEPGREGYARFRHMVNGLSAPNGPVMGTWVPERASRPVAEQVNEQLRALGHTLTGRLTSVAAVELPYRLRPGAVLGLPPPLRPLLEPGEEFVELAGIGDPEHPEYDAHKVRVVEGLFVNEEGLFTGRFGAVYGDYDRDPRAVPFEISAELTANRTGGTFTALGHSAVAEHLIAAAPAI